MVDGGGKIGGPPRAPPPLTGEQPAVPTQQAEGKPDTKVPADRFEKEDGRSKLPQGTQSNLIGSDINGSTNVLRLARDNPAAARQLVATLAGQAATTLSEIEREMMAARLMLEKLAKERFSKEARRAKAKELEAHRKNLAALKLRLAMGARKMALLQQVAGKLGDPRLDVEIDRLLRDHSKLKTDWGRRHHLLSVGSTLYGDDAETPDHLRRVVQTEVISGNRGEEVGDTLRAISPRRVIAELIARTIDGSVRDGEEVDASATRGEYGRTMQSYSMFSEVLESALGRDPWDED
ncbi:MAG: hypothetical protein V3T05_01960 [Myxococcota bacterium]